MASLGLAFTNGVLFRNSFQPLKSSFVLQALHKTSIEATWVAVMSQKPFQKKNFAIFPGYSRCFHIFFKRAFRGLCNDVNHWVVLCARKGRGFSPFAVCRVNTLETCSIFCLIIPTRAIKAGMHFSLAFTVWITRQVLVSMMEVCLLQLQLRKLKDFPVKSLKWSANWVKQS